jgi:hypothetical protein
MKTTLFFTTLVLIAFSFLQSTKAWDGYDYDKGTYVEIEKGNLVREGETIEIYDYEDGGYKDVEVESVDRYGSTVEVEVTDPETGETRTLDMDD